MPLKKLLLTLCILALSPLALAKININGAGASFPYPIYSKWFSIYNKENKDVQFNYQAIGSGGGIRQLTKQTVDFGASDAPMKKRDMKKAPWPVAHIPTVLGAVAIAYNVEGIKDGLKIDGATLVDIYLGKITKWNHPAIKKLNPKMDLPDEDVLVVRRADGSGTTAIFSDYLSNVSSEWKSKIGQGKSLRWPAGIGAKGNDGVTAMVKQTNGTIGYIELAYALKNNLSTVALKNKSDKFVQPSIKGVSSAAAASEGGDVTKSIVNQKGEDVYPISAFTYILLPKKEKEDKKLKEVKEFLRWALTDGQKYAKELHYAPLPEELRESLLKQL